MSEYTLIEILEKFQMQIDPGGIRVGVSRQALDELITEHEHQAAEIDRLRENNRKESIEIIAEIMESHKIATGECETNCDFVAAWETAIEALKDKDNE